MVIDSHTAKLSAKLLRCQLQTSLCEPHGEQTPLFAAGLGTAAGVLRHVLQKQIISQVGAYLGAYHTL
ncbi:uncharacterized protein QC761_107285 [Podospora bellae-mahoneyi]|uniref:Uncharacterized protein n=1 Tax=Podospora bellae-mahoneyi TaxID=2093777 RepID=A0ABR0FY84_9PEZI|nr:hypothetical protein QC761_107285 [Podospora bellae-mahoneyi]